MLNYFLISDCNKGIYIGKIKLYLSHYKSNKTPEYDETIKKDNNNIYFNAGGSIIKPENYTEQPTEIYDYKDDTFGPFYYFKDESVLSTLNYIRKFASPVGTDKGKFYEINKENHNILYNLNANMFNSYQQNRYNNHNIIKYSPLNSTIYYKVEDRPREYKQGIIPLQINFVDLLSNNVIDILRTNPLSDNGYYHDMIGPDISEDDISEENSGITTEEADKYKGYFYDSIKFINEITYKEITNNVTKVYIISILEEIKSKTTLNSFQSLIPISSEEKSNGEKGPYFKKKYIVQLLDENSISIRDILKFGSMKEKRKKRDNIITNIILLEIEKEIETHLNSLNEVRKFNSIKEINEITKALGEATKSDTGRMTKLIEREEYSNMYKFAYTINLERFDWIKNWDKIYKITDTENKIKDCFVYGTNDMSNPDHEKIVKGRFSREEKETENINNNERIMLHEIIGGNKKKNFSRTPKRLLKYIKNKKIKSKNKNIKKNKSFKSRITTKKNKSFKIIK